VARSGSHHAPRIALERTVSVIASARRAVVADRYATSAFAVEWRWLSELLPIADEWRDLAARSLEPNVFYEPGFALAAAAVFGDGVGAVLVWSGTHPRKLLGFFPARVSERRYGFKLPVLVAWTHPYGPLGIPLVERDAAEPVIGAWLAHLADNSALPGLVLLPLIVEDGPVAAALGRSLQRAQMPWADFGRHQRALLEPGEDRAHYLEQTTTVHRYREFQRTGRRLADLGALLFTASREPAAVVAEIDDFLALEARGWKGKAGTAADSTDDMRAFFKSALAALAAEGKIQIDRLLLDGKSIAAAITLLSGAGAWYWKIAYDEKFARYAPGMLLTAALTEQLAEDETIARTDSCAAPGNTTLEPIWGERLSLCDRLIAVRPSARFGFACRLEGARRAVMSAAKTWHGRLRAHR
jgi:CelD/BcsL family acetyltransferase involved in cellulose biosynthesis